MTAALHSLRCLEKHLYQSPCEHAVIFLCQQESRFAARVLCNQQCRLQIWKTQYLHCANAGSCLFKSRALCSLMPWLSQQHNPASI